MVARTGLEPAISTLKGWRLKPVCPPRRSVRYNPHVQLFVHLGKLSTCTTSFFEFSAHCRVVRTKLENEKKIVK